MCNNELARRQLVAKLLRESRQPGFSLAIPSINGVEVLVVDINTIKIVCLDEAGEVVRSRDRVRTGTRRDVARPERGDHKLDAGRVVLRLNRGPVACRECGPLVRLVPRAGSQPERKNAVAIPIRSSIDNE